MLVYVDLCWIMLDLNAIQHRLTCWSIVNYNDLC